MPRPTRTVKVFATKEQQAALTKDYEVIQKYDSFLLLHVSLEQVEALSKKYPLEDITEKFKIRIPGRRPINTKKPRIDMKGRVLEHPAYRGVKRLSKGNHHYLVQFVGPIKRNWLTRLKRLGAEPREPFSDYVYVMRLNEATLGKVAAEPFVRWVGHLNHRDRIKMKEGKKLARTRNVSGVYSVEFFSTRDLERGLPAIRKLGITILSTEKKAFLATLEINKPSASVSRLLERLSAIHGVRSIRKKAIKRTSNNVGAEIMNTDRAVGATIGLTGQGEIVAVCDTGLDTGRNSDIHPDFEGRVIAFKSYPITPDYSPWINNPGGDDGPADLDNGHGTHVAGSVLGSGTAEIPDQAQPIKGLAHKAKLVFQAVEQEMRWKDVQDQLTYGRYILAGIPDDLRQLFRYAYNKGARIHSNSWGGGESGEYDEKCRQMDEFVWKKKDFCVLVAAGNDGTDEDGDGRINLMSVTSPATAKNCITVGASESLRPEFNWNRYGGWWPNDYPAPPYDTAPMANSPKQVAAFSSRGPTEDGRLKPDVVAPGTFILSTRSRMLASGHTAWGAFPDSNLYFYMGGTSMATPLTAGAVALLREFLRDWVGFRNPSAALLKACLILGTRKLPGYSTASQVADNHQGYGRVDLDNVVWPKGRTRVYFLDDPTGLKTGQSDKFPIRVRSSNSPLRIAVSYSDFPGESLVNNLNLILTSPTGRTYVGNGEPGASLQSDTANNTEVIHIKRPRPGVWNLAVIGSNVPHGPQAYALVASGIITM
jgi:subtilisin family serine protease